MEVERVVVDLQVVVEQVGVLRLPEQLHLFGEHLAVGRVLVGVLHHEIQGRPRLADARPRVLVALDVEEHHVPDQATEVPARVDVVGDHRHTLWVQVVPEHLQDLVLHLRGHPGVDTVAEDVVEAPQALIDGQDVLLGEGGVPGSRVREGAPGLLDLYLRGIDAHEVAVRVLASLGDQVPSRGTAQLQDPTPVHRSRLHPQESCHALEAPDVRVPMGRLRVGNLVVAE